MTVERTTTVPLHNDPFNPRLMLYRHTAERAGGITISPSGRPDWFIASVTDSSDRLILSLAQIPEVGALESAHAGWAAYFPDYFPMCNWDNVTRRKVESFYLENYALRQQRRHDRDSQLFPNALSEASAARQKAKDLRGELAAITPKEIDALIEQALENQLP